MIQPTLSPNNNPQPTISTDVELSTVPNLLEQFTQDVEHQGLVGEKNNAAVVFLAAVSAKLTKPLSVTVQGSSSSGKNHLLNCVCEFIPEKDKKILSGMTSKVLMHAKENEYEHKVIVIAEYEGAKKADYAIRTFQSERRIQWEFVDTKKGIEKKTNTVRGPAAFLQATTEPLLHPENETRLLFVEIDESEEQTARINLQQALVAAGEIPDQGDSAKKWQKVLSSLEPDMKIVTPFATKIAQFFPNERVRSRRDFPKLLALIEATAYLHHHKRNQGPNGEIIASPADYLTAKKLFEHCYSFGPDKSLEELLRYAERRKTFRVGEIMEDSGWGKTKAYELVKRASENGCIAETEKVGEYKFLEASAVPPLNLPDVIEGGSFPEFRVN
jgi:hypothetical protein